MLMVNRRLALRTALVSTFFFGGLFAVHAVQSDRAVASLRGHAERAEAEGNGDKAIGYWGRYLELCPSDLEAEKHLAELIASQAKSVRDWTAAAFRYEKVLRTAPERHDDRNALAQLYLKMNRWNDALTHLTALARRTPDDARLLEEMGRCLANLNRLDDAEEAFRKCIREDATRIGAYERLAEILIEHHHRPTEAFTLLDAMIVANPQSAVAYLVRSRFRKSADDLAMALKLDPTHPEALLRSGEAAQRAGKLEEAQHLYAEGIRLHPKRARFYLALAWLELNRGNDSRATALLELGVRALPNDAELRSTLADLKLQQGDAAPAEQLLATAKSPMRYLEARLAMQRKQWDSALTLLEKLRTESVGNGILTVQTLLLTAECHGKRGDAPARRSTLDRIVSLEPNQPIALRLRAQDAFDEKRYADAERDLAILVRSPSCSFAARKLRVEVGAFTAPEDDRAGELLHDFPKHVEAFACVFDRAIAQGEPLAELFHRGEAFADQPQYWNMLAERLPKLEGGFETFRSAFAMKPPLAQAQAINGLSRTLGDRPELRQMLENTLRSDDIGVRLVTAATLTQWNDFTRAAAIYGEVLAKEPNNITALNNRAWLLASQRGDDALTCIERAMALRGVRPELLDTRARIRLARSETALAVDDLTRAIAQSAQPLSYFHLALAHLQQHDEAAARKSFREALTRGLTVETVHPDDRAIYRTLAER